MAKPASARNTSISSMVVEKEDLIDSCISSLNVAEPLALIDLERKGFPDVFVESLSSRLGIHPDRLFVILGMTDAASGEPRACGGHSVIGLVRLLDTAQEMVRNSTAPEAVGFDTGKWLGTWLESPLSALGGRKPADILDTPTGVKLVTQMLGAIQSGAYQ